MRKKDIELIKAVLDEVRVTPEQADRIISAVKESYTQEIQTELNRQYKKKLCSWEMYMVTDAGKALSALKVGDYVIVPEGLREDYRRARMALNKIKGWYFTVARISPEAVKYRRQS